MRALDRKLLRDLWSMKAQVVAIVAVIGTGVAMFAMYLSTFDSLERTRAEYYELGRFGDVFAGCKRAPAWLEDRIAEIPRVSQVETRVVVDVTLDVQGVIEPAIGRLLSIPDRDRDTLNDLIVLRGRYIDPDASDEVVVHQAFSDEHGLNPGDGVVAVINGRRRELTIAGIGLSPEYVYVIGPSDVVPDHRRFGVFWMGRRALSAAFDMEGAFNHVSLRLAPGQRGEDAAGSVTAELDRLLKPYGGLVAIERRHQQSHWFVENELRELTTMASILPVIFLAVAAFLLNIVLSRMIAVQRTQIAALKAVGYSNREVAGHYLMIGFLIAGFGAVVGCFAGAKLGNGLTSIYAKYFRFPGYEYELAASIGLSAIAISLAAAGLGSLGAVLRAVRLPPAEAMRPEPPARFEPAPVEALAPPETLGPASRMILRNIARRPWRFGLSSLGVGMAIALLILGSFFVDAIDHLIALQFDRAQRQDITVNFVEPRSASARHELERFPGVLRVEGFRAVPVRLRYENRTRQVSVLGLPPEPVLGRVIDRRRGALAIPEHGLLLSASLAELLGVGVGDAVGAEVLEGSRPTRRIVVSGLVDDVLGLSAYMHRDALARLLREDRNFSGAFLTADPELERDLFTALKETPGVAGVALTSASVRSFRETIRVNMMRIILFNVFFSGVIAVGVVYNAARISLSERARDLASLRVLGFTHGEVNRILLGELAVVTLTAVPIGLVCGWALAWLTLALLRNELYRIPLSIDPSTYGVSVLVVVAAAWLSGLLVRRRLKSLDLISVLKTSE